jgi:DNA-binding transcriptional LysR family regulator
MDRFAAISTFVAVAEQGGFASAGRKLGLLPSAVTRYVAALEAHLGVRLLNRTTRSVTLTDAGQRFLERSRRILGDLEEAEMAAENERGEPSGRLSVTAPFIFGRLHVAPLLCDLMRSFPNLEVELQLNDRNLNLVDEGIDVAVRIGSLSDSSDIARKAGATRRVLVASPEYLRAVGAPANPDSLGAHQLISVISLTSPNAWKFWTKDSPVEVPVQSKYVTNSADAAIWHAERSGGLTMALSYQVRDQIAAGTLQIVMPQFEPPVLPIQFVYASSRLLSAKVRALIDMAISRCDWSFVDV